MPDRAKCLEILGLKPSATKSEIKEAYLDLVKVWHPDRFSHDVDLGRKAGEKLSLINEAYQALKNSPARPTPVSPYYSGPTSVYSSRGLEKRSIWNNPVVSLIVTLILGIILFSLAWSVFRSTFYPSRSGQSLSQIV